MRKIVHVVTYDRDENDPRYRVAWTDWFRREGLNPDLVALPDDAPILELLRWDTGELRVRYIEVFVDESGESFLCSHGQEIDDMHVASRWVTKPVNTVPCGVRI